MKRAAIRFLTFAAILLCGLGGFTAHADQGIPPYMVWPEQYNLWSFNSVSANTYTFPGYNCWVSPLTNGTTASFFAFGNSNTSVYFPVFIEDASPALSEIVTPTALSTTPTACGFSAAPVNSHISFTVKSGTAGLQEAVYTLSQPSSASSTANDVMLDQNFYGLVAALPSNQTVAGIIAALSGSTRVQIVDTTTGPWTYYTWNGSKYVSTSGSGSLGNLNVTSYTGISAPTALST
jgi:hypothetical protein